MYIAFLEVDRIMNFSFTTSETGERKFGENPVAEKTLINIYQIAHIRQFELTDYYSNSKSSVLSISLVTAETLHAFGTLKDITSIIKNHRG